jgi:hypothetical protein
MKKDNYQEINSPFYIVWRNMKQRCRGVGVTKNAIKNYHDKGITYDPKWESFKNFYKDMINGYKRGLQIDRRDNNQGYCKENCRWVQPVKNVRNRSNTLKLTINNITRPLAEWCEIRNVSYQRALKRMRGYEIEDPEAILFPGYLNTYYAITSIKPCVECGMEGGTKRPNGLPRRSKEGLCNTCYNRKRRRENKKNGEKE